MYIVGYGDKYSASVANNLMIYMRTLIMVNICINPIIYGVMWRPFRSALDKVIYNLRLLAKTMVCTKNQNIVNGYSYSSGQGTGV